tara:strand:+ start:1827 stop:3506 length:1680 start_codon:yes stop_codon:yes gene_type:complete
MSLNLIVAQSIDEFNFVKSKVREDYKCLPLNLDLLLFCELNKIPFINLREYFDNNAHIEGLNESEKFLEDCDFGEFNHGVFLKRYKNLVRNYFNSVFFLKFILSKIEKKEKIEKIYISGWKKKNIDKPNKNYIIYEICKVISSKIIIVGQEEDDNSSEEKTYFYKLKKKYEKKNDTTKIIFLNFGYNFKRILYKVLIRKNKIIYITFEKINFFKSLILKILGVNIFSFEKIEINLEKKNIQKLNKIYNDKDILNIINKRNHFFYKQIQDLSHKCVALKEFIQKLEPHFVFLNLIRGVDGYLATLSREFNFKSICIPHGTISSVFDHNDGIYKKIIAENVFSGDSKYFSIQSKIAEKSLSSHQIKGEAIITGNLIFSDINKTKIKKREYILYAVTMKDFINYQFFGVEMFYEFYENLITLDKLAEKEKLKIIVKPHPSIIHLTTDLQKKFQNLIFSKDKVENLLKKTFLTISYSSTVIEDSICNKIPVILFDQWRRYKHCYSSENPNKLNQFLYYVKKKEDLITTIETIKNSDKEKFSDFIFTDCNPKKNIDKLLKKFNL